jgi:hypothetical protein
MNRARVLPAIAAALVALSAAGCAPRRAGEAPGSAARTTAGAGVERGARTDLDPIEARLLAAKSLRIKARIVSGGGVSSHFEGNVVAGAGQRMHWEFQGDLGARASDVRLVCDGKKMRGGSREQPFEFDAPPALREGTVITFVRMGLLHDVALLAEGRPPAHIDGTVRSWVTATKVMHAPGEPVRGAATERYTWVLAVEGGSPADVELWTDALTGLPVRRRMLVHFPEGDMQVAEEYDVTPDAPVDDAAFQLAPPLGVGP